MNLLGNNLKFGDILLIPNKTFYFIGGIQFNNLKGDFHGNTKPIPNC